MSLSESVRRIRVEPYSVRSDRLFCETLDYNILFRWFLDMGLEEPSFDASTFSKNRERLAGEDVALKFFDAVVREARALERVFQSTVRAVGGDRIRQKSHHPAAASQGEGDARSGTDLEPRTALLLRDYPRAADDNRPISLIEALAGTLKVVRGFNL